jgi:predicted aspartyl protease
VKPKKKWCNFHKTQTHDTEECRAANKPTDKNKSEQKTTYAIRESKLVPRNIDLDIIIGNKKTTALVDTGSAETYISEKLVNELNLESTQLKTSTTAEFADGSTKPVEKSTNIEFSIANDKQIAYKTECKILPNLAMDVLLGMSFLINNEAIINFKENILILDGKQYEIETSTCDAKENACKLIDKTKILSCTSNDKINQLVKSFRSKMPTLGTINNVEHRIDLTDNIQSH